MDRQTMHYNERGSVIQNNGTSDNTHITFPMMLPTSCMCEEGSGEEEGGRGKEGEEVAWREEAKEERREKVKTYHKSE